jgi:NADPH-dependent FMN reductase
MRLLAISGSLRRRSYNSALLDAAAAGCGLGIDFVFWNGLDTIPAYNEDATTEPSSVSLLKDEILHADAVLFATPEYNGSVPGMRTMEASVEERELAVAHAHRAFTADGLLLDPAHRTALTSIVETLHGRTCRRAA